MYIHVAFASHDFLAHKEHAGQNGTYLFLVYRQGLSYRVQLDFCVIVAMSKRCMLVENLVWNK